MKYTYKSIIAFIAALLVFGACSKGEVSPVQDDSVNTDDTVVTSGPVTITASIPEEGLTKVSLEQDPDNADGVVKLTWASGDQITVEDASDDSKSVTFTLKDGYAGQATAEFTADNVSALDGVTGFTIKLNSNMPADFASQTQSEDGSTAHLGYAATLTGVNTYDGITFSQTWATANGSGSFASSSVLRLRAKLPDGVAETVKAVIFKADQAIFNGDNSIRVAITNQSDVDNDDILNVYATLPVGSVDVPANTNLLFQFQIGDNAYDLYTAHRLVSSATTFASGSVNAFKLNCPNIASYANAINTGIGTSSNPYLIGDQNQMVKMHDLLVADTRIYFKMVDDVDLDGIGWEPLINSDSYQIDFNGGNHIISNMTIDNSAGTYSQSGFIGYLYGYIHDVVFDGANVNGGDTNSGIVIGRTAASSHAGNFSNVTVRNSTLTSSNYYVGGLCGYMKKCNSIDNCHVISSTLTSTRGNADPSLIGGLVGDLTPNGDCNITDCSVESTTISGGCTNLDRSGLGGLIGRISAGTVTINRCHTTGTLAPSKTNNVGGLVGKITSAGHTISNSYSTCSIQRAYTFAGGLVGNCESGAGVTIDHCFASGNFTYTYGYGGKGGLVGAIQGTDVTIRNSVAWNAQVCGGHDTTDYSSGAIVGFTHPNCVLENNYRNPGMTFNGLFWAPSQTFDHPNVNGTTTPLMRITSANDESSLTTGTAEDFAEQANQQYFSYHGKHLASDAVVTPDDTYGWVSSDL